MTASGQAGIGADETYAKLANNLDAWSDDWQARGAAAMHDIQIIVLASGGASLLLGSLLA